MEADGRRSLRPSARLGGLALLVACLALAVTGCITAKATPEIIYITLPPSTPGPTATPSAVAPTGTSASASAAPATATPVGGTPTVSSATVTASAPDGRWSVSFRKPVIADVAPAVVTAMNNSITTRAVSYTHLTLPTTPYV